MVSLSSLDIRISIIITLKSDLSYDLRDFGTQPTEILYRRVLILLCQASDLLDCFKILSLHSHVNSRLVLFLPS